MNVGIHNGAGSRQRAHLLKPLTDDELGHPLPPISFVQVGFMKCGSTSIATMLHEHPECRHSVPKEPHFFTHNYHRGMDWFRGTMAGYSGEPVIGESSMSYTITPWCPDVAKRLVTHNPDVKVIFSLRDPMDRLVSGWKMAIRSGIGHDSALQGFEQYVLHTEPRHLEAAPWIEPDLPFAPPTDPSMTRLFLNLTLYQRQIDVFRRHVADENILCLFLEDWKKNRNHEAARLCDFLGINPDLVPPISESGLNRAEHRREDTGIARVLKRSSAVNTITAKIPDGVRSRLTSGSLLSRPVRYDTIDFDTPFMQGLASLLRDESLPLLEQLGKPADFWSYRSGS